MSAPVYHQPWGRCLTCSCDFPVSKLRKHRRFGWQCYGPDTNECWDGLRQHDEEHYFPRPREGTRRTTAPITNTLSEGADFGFNLKDRTTGHLWTVSFGTEIAVSPCLFAASACIDGLDVGGGWYFVMDQDTWALTTSVPPLVVPSPYGLIDPTGGNLAYTPPF